ncbi:hypothetical protein QCA50_020523 [Cerrena zonata]|uniref:Uncharacterized protein n=1 Tax=Cerrena zonata TaxID=2478898 RepID=A0AAW0FCD8_9APHY
MENIAESLETLVDRGLMEEDHLSTSTTLVHRSSQEELVGGEVLLLEEMLVEDAAHQDVVHESVTAEALRATEEYANMIARTLNTEPVLENIERPRRRFAFRMPPLMQSIRHGFQMMKGKLTRIHRRRD